MKKVLASIATVAALSTTLVAGNTQTGCGLGSMLIKSNNSAVLYALQSISNNAISSNQIFGITTGTLGCKKTKIVMNERAEQFVASNMDILAKEIARGHGESLDTLAELLKVQDKSTFKVALQKNYNSIYTSQKVEMADVLDNISTTSL